MHLQEPHSSCVAELLLCPAVVMVSNTVQVLRAVFLQPEGIRDHDPRARADALLEVDAQEIAMLGDRSKERYFRDYKVLGLVEPGLLICGTYD